MNLNNEITDSCKPYRKLRLAKKIVVVDGMIGGGKNLLSSIVSSFPSVEMWIHRTQIEQVCALYHLGHMSLDAAKTLINTWIEEEILNQNMSRNVNFKPSDISSIFHDARPLRYFKRLLKSPLKAKESVEKEMPVLNLMTHVNTSYSKPLFEALGERLIYIRVSRHPMTTDMIKHNKKWTERWENDDRHSYIMYKTLNENKKPIHLPFYAKKIEKKYLNGNSTDKSILLFDQWIRNSDNFIDEIKKSTEATIIEIPYEKFVFYPEIYIKKISSALALSPDKKTIKMMRRQRVPRSSLTIDKKNYNLIDSFAHGRAYVKQNSSLESLTMLDKLANDYEERHNINK